VAGDEVVEAGNNAVTERRQDAEEGISTASSLQRRRAEAGAGDTVGERRRDTGREEWRSAWTTEGGSSGQGGTRTRNAAGRRGASERVRECSGC
jgi:hypothetical protein